MDLDIRPSFMDLDIGPPLLTPILDLNTGPQYWNSVMNLDIVTSVRFPPSCHLWKAQPVEPIN